MREVSGTTWTFQIIILFILIFACFLTLVLSYSKAYIAKNEMLSIIEKYEGITLDNGSKIGSLTIINSYLSDRGINTRGSCPASEGRIDWYGVKNYDGTYEKSTGGSGYLYCFSLNGTTGKQYYNVMLFYKFNLPVIGEIAKFKVKGRTDTFIGNKDRIG
ncbi:MAG: hypothetical protein K2M17_04020 [Bacilli bacterium]|nr:hypothetical protein [Bacilli bacterium]